MSVKKTYTRAVVLPTLADLEAQDPTRATLAKGRLAPFWKQIVRPDSFIQMEGAIRLDHPAIAGIADDIRQIWEAEPNPPNWGHVKQFSGAVAALVCELNGYQRAIGGRTPLKRKVGREHWNAGQVMIPN